MFVRDFREMVPGGALHQPEPVLELLAHLEGDIVQLPADQGLGFGLPALQPCFLVLAVRLAAQQQARAH
ncbi:hypothetical protein AHiyo4_41440 [Arthrobacter sp. Hiyo4]|nr:hypothetical protein AHiyo4_41440 [Arthrobacter sp. Hiyo4]